MQVLYLASEVLVIFIIVILLSKKNKLVHDRVLICWFCLIFINTHGFYVNAENPYHFFIELSSAVVFLHGPVIRLYYHTLTVKMAKFRWSYLLHLLPFTINVLFILPSLITGDLASFTESERNILMVAKLISIITYTLTTIVHLNWHKKTVKGYFSNVNKKELQWLKLVLYSILFIWILGACSQVAVHLNIQMLNKANEDLLVNMAVSMMAIIIAYYGFRQGSVFLDIPVEAIGREQGVEQVNNEQQPKETGSGKYKKSGLGKEAVEKSAILLQQFMKEQKPYLDPELTLLQLATAVHLSANDLSQVINEHFKVNFYEFINGYRVAAIKEAIHNGEIKSKTLLGIALDAGFNSKVSFNRAFKKMTGQTPTEYISAQKNS